MNVRKSFALLVPALLTLLVGCSSGSDISSLPLPADDVGTPVDPTPEPPPPYVGGLSASPSQLSLGRVFVGHTRGLPVVVTNTSGGTVTVASVAGAGGLRHGLTLPATIASGASVTFPVRFNPGAAGDTGGVLSLRDASGAILGDITVDASAAAIDGSTVVNVVDHGARGDGITDDRAAFQAAANAARDSGRAMYVPAPPGGSHYKLTGVVRIGSSVIGEPGALPEIRMYGANGADRHGDASPYTIFYGKGTRGTSITGLHLNGGRDFAPRTNVYGMAEQSHGIALQDASDIWIENNRIEATQGDNILIGGEAGAAPCQDVRVVNNQLIHAMRCSVFPGDTRRLSVYYNTISKVVEYQSSIDFEPNQPGQSSWDAHVAYNDFTTTRQYDHILILSTVATGITNPGGRISFHDNRGESGAYRVLVDLSAPGTVWVDNAIETSLSSAP